MARATAHQTPSAPDSLNPLFTRLVADRGERACLEALAGDLFRQVAVRDVAFLTNEQRAGLSLSLWELVKKRPPGAAAVRAYTPVKARKDSGVEWSLPHSVLETVNDDMPFLVDSIAAVLQRHNLTVHVLLHPVVKVVRDGNGVAQSIAPRADQAAKGLPESIMHIQFDAVADEKKLAEIVADVEHALKQVRLAVTDWRGVLAKLEEAIKAADTNAKDLAVEEIEEARDFLRWLGDNHFTFLGYREYKLEGTREKPRMAVRPGSGLGILRDDKLSMFEGLRNREDQPDEARNLIQKKHLLFVTKTTNKSDVHRPVHMDGVFVKTFDDKGNVNGERLFVGLLTSVAYSRNANEIPLLRRKVETVLKRADFNPSGHDGKALTHILNTYPRDELLQIGTGELYNIAIGVLQLQERQRVALFLRRDPFERSFTALVYAPRDRYDTHLRQAFIAILERRLESRLASFEMQIDTGPLARLYLILRTQTGAKPDIDVAAIEAELVEAARSWGDRLRQHLTEQLGEAEGTRLYRDYHAAFPASYHEAFTPLTAVDDIRMLEVSRNERRLGIRLYQDQRDDSEGLRLRLYQMGGPIMLSATLPMVENIGLRVQNEHGPYEIVPAGANPRDPQTHIWIHDYHTRLPRGLADSGVKLDLAKLRAPFEEAFAKIWYDKVEDDLFNRLVLIAELNWKEVNLLRAIGKYLRQAAFPFGTDTLADTLCQHPKASCLLVALFKAMFDPKGHDKAAAEKIAAELSAYIKDVSNQDEDRILRRYLNLVQSMLRTNYWQQQKDGRDKPYLSFKLDSRKIDDLPLPRPMYEIFVYSPRVEAVHLRSGKVARGGIRWSDRLEDFRTEVLGLMKAQVVKNAVIVPTGSKGGFVVKRPDANYPQQEAIACYRTMMRGLLDITDNVVDGKIVPPASVVRRDEDDPYLVVAADKGTATFSDTANEISLEYDFWLGDAFASGGSVGYDHKQMGITARGAWEAVKRHFREIGIDVQSETFTCIGVGDMAGDVFGNGLLQSDKTLLLAAFNHLHIFIDPHPDAAASYEERKRLFKLAKGSWDGYEPKLISKGGGVFSRKAKSIPLSPEIKERFGLTADEMTPADLIRALLTADVDLLFFGGIGTFIKSAAERNAEVNDKANDSFRIDATEVRAKVIGEGANLGMTQKARIAYALAGGRLNTDAIDNSAGVDTSDHEVNIKILFRDVLSSGAMDIAGRNKFLSGMTNNVATLVLADNYRQTEALSLMQAEAVTQLPMLARFMRQIEKAGLLHRKVETLPDDETLRDREQQRLGLTRPEAAVMLAYGKIWLKEQVLKSKLLDNPDFDDELVSYFPEDMKREYRAQLFKHQLRREIKATVLVNDIVNRFGPHFVPDLMARTRAGLDMVLAVTAMACRAYDLYGDWQAINDLDNKVHAAVQTDALTRLVRTVSQAIEAVIDLQEKDAALPDIARDAKALAAGISTLMERQTQTTTTDATIVALQKAGASKALIGRLAAGENLVKAPFAATIAAISKADIATVAVIMDAVGRRLGMDWIIPLALALKPTTETIREMLTVTIADLRRIGRAICLALLREGATPPEGSAETEWFDQWLGKKGVSLGVYDQLLGDLKAGGTRTIETAALALMVRRLQDLLGSKLLA